LFLEADGFAAMRQRMSTDPIWQQIRPLLLAAADRELSTQPVERVLIGRRLLDKSRTYLGASSTSASPGI
jgi:hypothetical protein